MPPIEELLLQLSRGTVSLADAKVELARLAQASGQHEQSLIVAIGNAVGSGQLDPATAQALLQTIANASERTEVAGAGDSPAPLTTSRTLIADADKTLLPDADRTMRSQKRSAATLSQAEPAALTMQGDTQVRPASADVELTVHKTLAMNAAVTEAMSRSSSRGEAPDATMQPPAVQSGTVARTLLSPVGGVDGPASHVGGLKPPAPAPIAGIGALHLRKDEPVVVRPGDLQPGSVIKQRFVLDSLIGKGGMGLVFSAIDRRKEEAQDPNPRVALKILNANFRRHAHAFIALQREARKAQTLAHPNVVTVFDFDRDGDTVFMTMELLNGRSLEAMVREARGKGIGRERALLIIRGIAQGLAYAHRKGIVHSDLKPGNVFITSDHTPKILDFGIARAVPNSSSEEAPDVFDAGSFGAYTEAYATNEMVNGIDPHPADDLYALGIIGYELLTGFHPFHRHSAPNARKLGIRPPPLSGVKRSQARALERCLSFDREDRPKDADEFLKLFRGASTLQKATLAATAALAIASSYLWHQNYLENSPAIPFSKLPAETQRQFTELIRQGGEEWRFYEREKNVAALQAAVEQYARAYTLHPRNRDAVGGLERSADALLRAARGREEQREVASFLQDQSDYFRSYPPVIAAAE